MLNELHQFTTRVQNVTVRNDDQLPNSELCFRYQQSPPSRGQWKFIYATTTTLFIIIIIYNHTYFTNFAIDCNLLTIAEMLHPSTLEDTSEQRGWLTTFYVEKGCPHPAVIPDAFSFQLSFRILMKDAGKLRKKSQRGRYSLVTSDWKMQAYRAALKA